MNRNMIIGLAAGVAAVTVIALLSRRKGSMELLLQDVQDLADKVQRQFKDQDKFGMGDVIPKGEDKNISKSSPRH